MASPSLSSNECSLLTVGEFVGTSGGQRTWRGKGEDSRLPHSDEYIRRIVKHNLPDRTVPEASNQLTRSMKLFVRLSVYIHCGAENGRIGENYFAGFPSWAASSPASIHRKLIAPRCCRYAFQVIGIVWNDSGTMDSGGGVEFTGRAQEWRRLGSAS